MVSTGLNVLRWSALGLGVVYGISHQRTIRANDKQTREKREYAQKQQLISQAKAEYANKSSPPSDSPQIDEIEALMTGQLK